MYKDEIIEEVWKNRDQYAKRNHNNLNEIVNNLKKRQDLSQKKFIDRRKLSKKNNLSF